MKTVGKYLLVRGIVRNYPPFSNRTPPKERILVTLGWRMDTTQKTLFALHGTLKTRKGSKRLIRIFRKGKDLNW